MKKFTLFMLAACAWFTASTSAMADTTEPTVATSPTAASSLTSGYYVVKVSTNSVKGYVYHSTSDTSRPFRVKSEGDDATAALAALSENTVYVWYANVASDGTFTLQNLGSGDFIPAQQYFQGYNDMVSSKAPHTFANAAILKSQTCKSSSDTYTLLDGGSFLNCTNYSDDKMQIHTNKAGEPNLSYWGQNLVEQTDGTGSIVEFAFYAITGTFSSEDNIQKNTLIEVTETDGSTTTKWAGYAGQTYALHSSVSDYVNVGFAFTTTAPSYTPTELTISESNHAFTITAAQYTPVEGVFSKYYRIYSVATDRRPYMSTKQIPVGTDGLLSTAYYADNTINRNVKMEEASDAYVPQIWQLENAGNGKVKIKNTNNSRYISSEGDMPISDAAAGTFYIKKGTGKYAGFDEENEFEVNNGSSMMHCAGWGNSYNLMKYNSDSDKGCYWKFEEVTTVPVTIDATASYATVGMPFAVTVPEGVTAYTAESANGGYITLKEITSKVIPANTGAILYKDGGGDVTLTITTDPNTEIGTNILTATTAKRTGYTAGDTYVLALNSENKAAFLKSNLTVVPANKAYVAASELTESNSNVLNFNFGGDVTGISSLDAVDGTSAPTAYYDLNGRRVLYPAHGIFVTAKGKKVLVK